MSANTEAEIFRKSDSVFNYTRSSCYLGLVETLVIYKMTHSSSITFHHLVSLKISKFCTFNDSHLEMRLSVYVCPILSTLVTFHFVRTLMGSYALKATSVIMLFLELAHL